MVKQRAKVTADTFNNKKQTALDKLVGNTPEQIASEVETDISTPAPTETKPAGEQTYIKPTSFYLDDPRLDKLDDLIHAYKKRKGKRISRSDIVRALVDQADLETILDAIT